MTTTTNGFLDELSWRGMLHQTTSPELAAHLASGVRAGYAGFDPTSDSLTIGNFMGIKLLAHLQRAGHRPIVVSGGGTGLIGDPSGKSAERQLLTRDLAEHNARSQQRIFDRFLDFSGPRAAIIRNNIDWLSSMSYLDMLRDIGKHFSVNQMIARDSVASRLEGREQGISYTEFSYMILQAYDFLHLHRADGCTIQLGGSDQFGNIVSGIDLIRRLEQHESFGATCPLVTTSDGQKIGKTEKGAIWLTADRTSPYRFFQYWMNTSDADAVKFLRWFTFLDAQAVDALAHSLATEPGKRETQKALAAEMTRMTHGETELARARATSEAIFSGDVQSLDAGQIFRDRRRSSVERRGGGCVVDGRSHHRLHHWNHLCCEQARGARVRAERRGEHQRREGRHRLRGPRRACVAGRSDLGSPRQEGVSRRARRELTEGHWSRWRPISRCFPDRCISIQGFSIQGFSNQCCPRRRFPRRRLVRWL